MTLLLICLLLCALVFVAVELAARWWIRFSAYPIGLTDRYPPFSLSA